MFDDDDDLFEIRDADIPRVDLVDSAANGHKFLLLKSDGVMSPDLVKALVEDVEKAEKTTASLNDLPDSAFAYVEAGGTKDDQGKTVPRSLRHFPIMDAAHVRNALARAPQSPFGDKAMPKIEAAAKKFGIDTVQKDAGDDDSLLEAPDPDAEGDADLDPSSPAWESAEANTAVAALSDLARLRAVVGMLADREGVEAATNDPDDIENVWALEDAQCAIDYAMSVIAPYAVDEQAEVDLSDVTKSVMAHRADIQTVESMQPLIKVGAKLSANSMAKLTAAKAAIDDLVASMPAPTTTEGDPAEKPAPGGANPTAAPEGGTPVAKKIPTPADVAKSLQKKNGVPVADTTPVDEAPIAKTETVSSDPKQTTIVLDASDPLLKAGDPQILVYDQNGNVVGSVDPKNLTTFQNSATPGADDAGDSTDDGSTDDESAPSDAAPADAAPAADPVAQTTIPGTDTIQSPPDDDVTKAVAMTVAQKFEEALRPFAEKFEQTAELAKSVEVLKGQLAEVMKMPDDRKSPVLNGSIGKAGEVSRDGQKVESFAEIKKQIDALPDSVEKATLTNTLAFDAIKQRFAR